MSKTKNKESNFKPASKYNRGFSVEFKRIKVKEIVEKRISIGQFCKLYQVSRTSVYKWLYQYSDLERGVKQVVQMESEAFKTKQLLIQIAELEQAVGRKQLEIDFLNKTFELASAEVGYDLKKKYAARQSNISASKKVNIATK